MEGPADVAGRRRSSVAVRVIDPGPWRAGDLARARLGRVAAGRCRGRALHEPTRHGAGHQRGRLRPGICGAPVGDRGDAARRVARHGRPDSSRGTRADGGTRGVAGWRTDPLGSGHLRELLRSRSRCLRPTDGATAQRSDGGGPPVDSGRTGARLRRGVGHDQPVVHPLRQRQFFSHRCGDGGRQVAALVATA